MKRLHTEFPSVLIINTPANMDQFIAEVDEEEDINILPQTEAKVAYVAPISARGNILKELSANIT